LDIGNRQPGRIFFANQLVLSACSVLLWCGGVLKDYAAEHDPAACLLRAGNSVESGAFIFSSVQQLGNVCGGGDVLRKQILDSFLKKIRLIPFQ